MTDDIVDRLRAYATKHPGSLANEVILDAASTIEVLRRYVGEENRATRLEHLYERYSAEIKSMRWKLMHAVYCPRKGCSVCEDIEKEISTGHPRQDLIRQIECGRGWLELIMACHYKLESLDPNYKILQIKEKYGNLRYYFSTNTDDETRRKMQNIAFDYEERSCEVCEECGYPGTLEKFEGWYKTLCDTHWEQRRNR